MLAVKYAAPKFGAMDDATLSLHLKALLLKVHVITGWPIPASDALYTILLDQFRKHLSETYSELNPEEVEYAFRTRGTGVEDWGKQMNLNLIDKVLAPYLRDRYRLSETEAQMKQKDDGYCNAVSLNFRREEIEKSYQLYLRGDGFEVVYWYWYWYDVLVQDGVMAADMEASSLTHEVKTRLVLQCFAMAKVQNRKNLYVKA